MKKLIMITLLISGVLSISNNAVSKDYKGDQERGGIVFAVEQLLKKGNVKNIEYQNGESFDLGKSKRGHSLYFRGRIDGINNVIKVNCKTIKSSGELEYCKPVKTTRV